MDATPDRRRTPTDIPPPDTSSKSKKADRINRVPPHFVAAGLILVFSSSLSAQNITSPTPGLVRGSHSISVSELTTPSKVWDHLAAAHRAFSRGNMAKAEREVDLVLNLAPASAPAFSMRALLKLARHDPAGAAEDAAHAVLLDSFNAESYVTLAMAYNSLKKFPEAEKAAGRSLELRPDSWQGRLEIAKSLYGQNEFVAALHELQRLDTDFPDAHLVRGNTLMKLGRSDEGKREFQRFLDRCPGDPRRVEIQRIILTSRPSMADQFR